MITNILLPLNLIIDDIYLSLDYKSREYQVGTRERSGFKKLLLGSIASSVVTYAHCPVMVVK